MKRQYFDISLNGSIVATTYAWNSAIRTIERLVRERSVAVGGVYKLVDSRSEGPDKWHFTRGHYIKCPQRFTRGHRTWQSAHETLRYDINLRGSIPTC